MVLAATNRPWDLDEAIRRRLEKRVYIPLPNGNGRKRLFEINLQGMAVDDDVDWDVLVRETDGYSGCDLANVCREAAMGPMRRKLDSGDFDLDQLGSAGTSASDINLPPPAMADFLSAIQCIQKSVGPDQLGEFRTWMDQFGAS